MNKMEKIFVFGDSEIADKFIEEIRELGERQKLADDHYIKEEPRIVGSIIDDRLSLQYARAELNREYKCGEDLITGSD